MDAALFAKMLSDPQITDLKKLGYRYPQANMKEFVELLHQGFYQAVPLKDFHGAPVVYLDSVTQVRLSAAKVLLTPQSGGTFGVKAMEDEIISTFSIEQIDTSRDSVRKILSGYAPANRAEERIYSMKKGLEFISNLSHRISESTIQQLYQLVIAPFLPEDNRLLPGARYRHDSVYIVGDKIEHTGLPWKQLPDYMNELTAFIDQDSEMNDLLKAALIHFYVAYLHPWFDGNGRMARLLHLWFLVQQGYPSTLFVPLSRYIENSRKGYYNAYTLVEQNAKISGALDVTPFLTYFIQYVYHKLETALPAPKSAETFQQALREGHVTEKELALWRFVLSAYGTDEFSTKQLEKDFGNAAYATIRSFVLKFTDMGLLRASKYGNRTKYRLAE